MKTISEQIRAKRIAPFADAAFVVVVDDVPHGFAKRRDAAAFATEQLFNGSAIRIETTQLRFAKNGRRFI